MSLPTTGRNLSPVRGELAFQRPEQIREFQAGARDAEVHRSPGRADVEVDVEVLVEGCRPRLRELVHAHEKRRLELQSLDVLDTEDPHIVVLPDDLTVRAGHGPDVPVDQRRVQGRRERSDLGFRVDEHGYRGQLARETLDLHDPSR